MDPAEFDNLPPAPGLNYETPSLPPKRFDSRRTGWQFLRLFRRIVFMVGMGLFFSGLGHAFGESAAESMSAGAALIGFCIPLGRFPGEPKY